MQSLNFGELVDKSEDYSLLEEGTYNMVIVEAEAKQSKNGKTMFVCKFKVTSEHNKGKTVTHRFTISPESPAALGYLFRDMETLGLQREWFNTQTDAENVARVLVDRQAQCSIEHKAYNDNVYANITNLSPIPGYQNPAPAAALAQGVPDLGQNTTAPTVSATPTSTTPTMTAAPNPPAL